MASVPLHDRSVFGLVSGLWKGSHGPLKEANVVRSTNFRGDGVLDFTDVVQLPVEARLFAERALIDGDIVIERSGGGPKQPVGRVAYFVRPNEASYFTSNFTTALRVLDRQRFDPSFVALFLHALYLDGATETLQRATTGIRNLDWQEYLRFEVPELKLTDQRALAKLIGAVRDSYCVERKQLENTHLTKKAVMAELFTRGLRGEAQKETAIGWVPESWPLRRLDEIAKVISTRMAYSDLESMPNEEISGDAVDVLGIKVSDMNRLGNEVIVRQAATSRVIGAGVAARRCAPPGTIIFPKRGAAIATNKKRMTAGWTVFDPNVIGVTAQGVDRNFLFQWFQRFDLKTITEAGPTPQLNKKNLDPLLIAAPSSQDEQQEIGSILDAIDRKIALHQQKRAVLEALFKALLHKLMTGEIDVNDLDLTALTTLPTENEGSRA